METIFAALFIGVVGPVIVVALSNRARRQERVEDYARQDEVANRLLNANDVVGTQLNEIHTLVNSNMTTALENELSATRRELVLMKVIAGDIPTEAARVEIATTEARIGELEAQLNDRIGTS